MPSLDMRTIFACYLLLIAICSAIMALQWRQYRRRYRGLGWWSLGFGLQLPGLALVSLRGSVPDLVSATAGNALIIFGLAILLVGLRSFFGLRGRAALDFAAFALFAAAHAWFTVGRPDLGARIVAFSSAMLFVCVRGILILSRLDRGIRSMARGEILVLALFCLSSLGRIAILLLSERGSDFLDERSLDTVAMTAYLALTVALTFSMVSMIGRRAFFDQERLIEEKSRAEASLAASEEKFSKAFLASPDAITITRLSDGRLVEVNDGFCRLTGYSREEAIGAGPVEAWGERERWLDLTAAIGHDGFVKDREVILRAKSGRDIHASCSGGFADLRGEAHVVSVFRDLSEKDRAGRLMLVRLELREYSVGHDTEELMVKALDEIEAMTDSRIGFYHSVDEERGTVTLQSWSTRTTRDFCQAEGGGAHYPVASAGVWADCIRSRRPVVHNDYPSLPNRRGMPEGHAPLRRELVVPTFRDDRIVSVLGVGNKPTDYVGDDIALVSFVADLVWTIVEQKKADERILELNARLAELAMTDELTGSANRRAFFSIAERELAKAGRYSSPLSFLMIDIDNFKLVNDAHGHDAGDAVLRSVVRALKEQVRDVDLVARLGGEEFGVLMPSTRLSDALVSAERLRAAVAGSACEFGGVEHRVTISVGVSARADGVESLDAIMKAADEALYRAKAAGRDRVVAA